MPKSMNPLLARRKSSSASPVQKRKQSLQTSQEQDRLEDTGLAPSFAPAGVLQDVQSLINYALSHMWAEIPERGAGMGSERISEVLRFRAQLPRIVGRDHLYALSVSSTATERELARLIAEGVVRRFVVPGRGKGGAGVGEGIVLVEDWEAAVRASSGLTEEVKEKYCTLLSTNPTSTTASTTSLSPDEIRDLVRSGFLTSPSGLSSSLSDLFAPLTGTSTLSQSGHKAATGTLAAVGGTGAVRESGYGGGLATQSQPGANSFRADHTLMTLSLPSTGAYLKLLTSARTHLLALLKASSPRYKECTLDLLKEKWEGNIPNDEVSRVKRARGDWSGVLPGKTKKWKEFYGMEFEFVVAGAVGEGLVEAFETGAVGTAVRAS